MADFIDFNNATFEGGFGGGDAGDDMLFDDLFGQNPTGDNANNGQGFVPPPIERQAVIFLIDCSVSMFAPSYDDRQKKSGGGGGGGAPTTTFYHTPFSKAVKFARDFCQQKVFTAEKDLTAVVLYNSAKPLNQYNFPSIFVFQEFNSPSAPQVQELDTLSRAGIFVHVDDGNTAANNNNNNGAVNAAIRFNANTYEDFRTMIGHADADILAGGSDGRASTAAVAQQPQYFNPVTGAPIQPKTANGNNKNNNNHKAQQKAAALSEVLWTCQHLFHFLKHNAHSNYVFTKHIMVFTDKENPIVAGYAASVSRGLGSGGGGGVAGMKAELLKRVLLEYERAESRIRDLHEDGVTLEVFGYTEDPSANAKNNNNDTTSSNNQVSTIVRGQKNANTTAFNPQAFWTTFLNGPSGEGTLMSDELRKVLRGVGSGNHLHGMGGGGGGGLITAGSENNSGKNKNTPPSFGPSSASGPHNTNTFTTNINNASPSAALSNATPAPLAPFLQQQQQPASPAEPIDWFSTLPKGHHHNLANSGGGGGSSSNGGGSIPNNNTNSLNSSNHGLLANGSDGNSGVGGGGGSSSLSFVEDELHNLPKGTVKVALGRVYPLPRPAPEGKEKQSLHRQLDANLGGTADAQEEVEQALMMEGMMMKTAYVRQHATRSVGSLLVTFGGNAAAIGSCTTQPSSSSSASSSVPCFAVKVYRPIVPMAKPKFSWRHSRTNEVLVTKTAYIDNATGKEVVDSTKTAVALANPAAAAVPPLVAGGGAHPNNSNSSGNSLLYYAEVAGERACFNATEKQQIKTGTFLQTPPTPVTNPDGTITYPDDPFPPGIRVIGFKPYDDAVKIKYSLNRAVFIHPYCVAPGGSGASASSAAAAAASDPSVRFFVGLHRTLTRRRLVAIAEMVSRRSGQPSMVLMVPSVVPNTPVDPSSTGSSNGDGGAIGSNCYLAGLNNNNNPYLSASAPTPSPTQGGGGGGGASSSVMSSGPGGMQHGLPEGYLQGALAVDGCGFHVISLPYADDIRSMNAFKRFNKASPAMPSDDLVTKAKKVIQKLSVTYFPDAITNPTLAHQYRQLQRLALGNDEMDEEDDSFCTDTNSAPQPAAHGGNNNNFNLDDDGNQIINMTGHNNPAGTTAAVAAAVPFFSLDPREELRRKRRRIQDAFDVTLPHKEGMAAFKPLYNAFKDTAFPATTYGIAGGYNAEIWAPLPKPKAPGPSKDDVESINWALLVAQDKVGTLTMPSLQAFLKLHGQNSTGKKAELVERVKTTWAKVAAKKAAAAAGAAGAAPPTVKPEMATQ